MAQVVASQPYCLENSLNLTRTSSYAFFRSNGHDAPTVIDKTQTQRVYHLQRTPYVKTRFNLEPIENERNEYTSQPNRKVYHRPMDMSDASMAKFSFGKSRPDPQRLVPRQMTIANLSKFNDRTARAHIGPGGSINPGENARQTKDFLQNGDRLPTQIPFRKQPRTTVDDLARNYMYTSTQQAAFDEVPLPLPTKKSIPSTTYEENGSDPLLTSRSLPSFYDSRGYRVLEWDRAQPRNTYYIKKPFQNVAPLSRAKQISGYSGCIGGDQLENIDNPTIDFQPYTIVRSEQPKCALSSYKPNIPHYTGKTFWNKLDPVSHCDESGRAFTSTAAVHKSLPFDTSTPRYVNLHGPLSCIVTTVHPQNPFNQIDNMSSTVNASLDSRSYFSLQDLPRRDYSK